MRSVLHHLDLRYAALADAEIEDLWRAEAGAEYDLALVRQLVLRALEVIDLTCSEVGTTAGLTERDIEHASDEVALRLFARLQADKGVKNVRALAHALALEVIADPERRRRHTAPRLGQRRPELTLIKGGARR